MKTLFRAHEIHMLRLLDTTYMQHASVVVADRNKGSGSLTHDRTKTADTRYELIIASPLPGPTNRTGWNSNRHPTNNYPATQPPANNFHRNTRAHKVQLGIGVRVSTSLELMLFFLQVD